MMLNKLEKIIVKKKEEVSKDSPETDYWNGFWTGLNWVQGQIIKLEGDSKKFDLTDIPLPLQHNIFENKMRKTQFFLENLCFWCFNGIGSRPKLKVNKVFYPQCGDYDYKYWLVCEHIETG